MRRVIIESPYAGDIEANVEYARAAMRDSLNRGEAPIASHLLYTQPGILRDEVPEEREWGIQAGFAWRSVADLAVFYVDRNWSGGMIAARSLYLEEGFPFEVRMLASEVLESVGRDSDGTAPAAQCEDIAVPQDCQARAESIARKASPETPHGMH